MKPEAVLRTRQKVRIVPADASREHLMEREHFDRTLSALRRRAPFRPFAVRFVSGESVRVDHPEALVVRAGVAAYLAPAGGPTRLLTRA